MYKNITMKLALINMPFADIRFPSFALSQIKSAIKLKLGACVETDIFYINHDFALFLGIPLYNNFDVTSQIAETGLEIRHNTDSIRDLYFRHLAFPAMGDNFVDVVTANCSKDRFDTRQRILKKRELLSGFFYDIIEKYQLIQYDVIGFTSMFEQQLAAIALGRLVKKLNKDVTLILGGPNCEYPSSFILSEELSHFDYIISGYGVSAMIQLLQFLLKEDTKNLWKIKGLYSRNINKQRADLQVNYKQYYYGEPYGLNDILSIDYTDFYHSYYNKLGLKNKPIVFFETSRGCWWAEKEGCTFCAINGNEKKYTCMSSQKAIEYFNLLFKSNHGKSNFFWATDSTLPLHYLDEVFPFVKKDSQQRIFYEVRADMTKAQIAKLRRNDIRYVQVGIEALSTPILKLIHKGTTAFTNLIFLKLCCEYEINVLWNLLSGIPGEEDTTYLDYFKLIPLLKHLSPPSGIWSISYQKNSILSQHEKDGLQPVTRLLENLYPFPKESIKSMAYYYELLNNRKIYSKKKIKTIYEISMLINQWKASWIDASRVNRPRLYMYEKQGQYILVDSRFDNEITYSLTGQEAKFLIYLNMPRSLDEIITYEPHRSIEMLQKFQSLQLLFEENKTYLSLACRKRNINFKPILPETLQDILEDDNSF